MNQNIWQYLDEQAKEQGIHLVKKKVKSWLRQKTDPGVPREKRIPVPKDWITEKYVDQDGECPLCNLEMSLKDKNNPVVGDHIQPIVKGGKTEKRNIQAAHRNCNSAKGDMDMNEWSKYKQAHKIGV